MKTKPWYKHLLLLFCFFCSTQIQATHIVGGELELKHLSGNTYRLSMVMYFDNFYGNPGAIDNIATINIFRKSTNTFVTSIGLPIISDTFVPYSNPECAIGSLSTRKIVYSANVILSNTIYNEIQGYYMMWDRCCRNGVIANIVSPGETGQLFYLEFPAIVRFGEPFYNSTPSLFPPLSDFACRNKPFYFDFSGVDDDGDSLVYSLSIPLRGFSSSTIPLPGVPSPAPYPGVTFVPGLGLTNMIPGAPTLAIDAVTGQLTITPTATGLFVFAIRCEEYRGGVKIGEVRRDYQMLVINCPDIDAPEMVASFTDGTPLIFGDTLTYVAQTDTCIQFTVTDINPSTNITMQVIPKFGTPTGFLSLTPNSGSISGAGDALLITACLPECPLDGGTGVYAYDIVAFDNSCALPLSDTFRLYVRVLPPPNDLPLFTTFDDALLTLVEPGKYEITVPINTPISFGLQGTDLDNNTLALSGSGVGFTLGSLGMSFPSATGTGSVSSMFNWLPTCDHIAIGDTSASYTVRFFLNESYHCGPLSSQEIEVKINIFVPYDPNENPTTYSSLDFDPSSSLIILDHVVGDLINFDVFVTDLIDLDSIRLIGFGEGFTFASEGMIFTNVSGRDSIGSNFSWQTDCFNLPNIPVGDYEREFVLKFVGTDFNDCHKQTHDTLTVVIRLVFIPDPNTPPTLTVDTAAHSPMLTLQDDGCYYRLMTVDDNIRFDLLGQDIDNDFIRIFGQPIGFEFADYGMVFEPVEGIAPVSTFFSWQTKCSDLRANFANNIFDMLFIVEDVNRCDLRTSDTVCVRLELQDKPQPYDTFLPPNVFTPNDDDKNAVFTMPTLPIDNCKDQFDFIAIYNRWGKKVYESNNRDFAWDGSNLPSGVYYYELQFINSSYKGWVTIVK